jgi:hypothetical protein
MMLAVNSNGKGVVINDSIRQAIVTIPVTSPVYKKETDYLDNVTLTLFWIFGVQKFYFWRITGHSQVELADSAPSERKNRPIFRM